MFTMSSILCASVLEKMTNEDLQVLKDKAKELASMGYPDPLKRRSVIVVVGSGPKLNYRYPEWLKSTEENVSTPILKITTKKWD